MKREEAEAIYDLGKEAVVEILLKMDARITALEILNLANLSLVYLYFIGSVLINF
jgi:hypothetical protein